MLLLIALHEVKSLRKAAAMLNMTQPTATKLLQDLEHNIGLPLFDRGRRGMQPTNYGDVMIRHARLVLADLDRTRLELEALSSGATGQIKIGAVISAIPFLLARAVAKLKRQHPRLFVSINVGTSDLELKRGSEPGHYVYTWTITARGIFRIAYSDALTQTSWFSIVDDHYQDFHETGLHLSRRRPGKCDKSSRQKTISHAVHRN